MMDGKKLIGMRCWDPSFGWSVRFVRQTARSLRCAVGFLAFSHSSGLADVLTRTLCGPPVRYNSSEKRKSRCVYAFVTVASLGGLHCALR